MAPSLTRDRRRARLSAWLPWCAPALFLAAVLGGVALVSLRPPLVGVLLVALVLVPIAWVLVSTLWPARAERGCPACKADALVRSDPHTTHGLLCRACGFRDDSASAWLLAEEEGPLEELVLSQRARERDVRGRARRLDSPHRKG